MNNLNRKATLTVFLERSAVPRTDTTGLRSLAGKGLVPLEGQGSGSVMRSDRSQLSKRKTMAILRSLFSQEKSTG